MRRSIPACAGEPTGATRIPVHATVYPRVCGGTLAVPSRMYSRLGLSPRVRGNRRRRRRQIRTKRSIPACAGEPYPPPSVAAAPPVYPRVCGGTDTTELALVIWFGLSPRVRGNLVGTPLTGKTRRSIPACAGEPSKGCGDNGLGRVYPRVCGGTWVIWWGGGKRRGLSPRVRGNRGCRAVVRTISRSIPACAGEPLYIIVRTTATRVYPRVCGGTPCACAAAAPAPVYPRVCGGTRTGDGIRHHRGGLSPRVRGNQAGPNPGSHQERSIPACAGEPAL